MGGEYGLFRAPDGEWTEAKVPDFDEQWEQGVAHRMRALDPEQQAAQRVLDFTSEEVAADEAPDA